MLPMFLSGGAMMLAVLITSCLTLCIQASATQKLNDEAETGLCEALQAIKPGERIPITVAGIYSAGFEQSVLYDPEEPLCVWDVQPSTWVELSGNISGRSRDLDQEIKKARRALVRFKGELLGPKPVGADDLSLPPNIAWANRAGGLRYGHLGAFRTKLVVQAVLDVRPVPASQPWGGVWHREQLEESLPRVRSAEMPHYPLKALQAGISGHVTVEIGIEKGSVVRTIVKSGDRALAAETEENIRSWKFDSVVSTTLTTTFVYQLEPRLSGTAGNYPRIELQLPSIVRVTEANAW